MSRKITFLTLFLWLMTVTFPVIAQQKTDTTYTFRFLNLWTVASPKYSKEKCMFTSAATVIPWKTEKKILKQPLSVPIV